MGPIDRIVSMPAVRRLHDTGAFVDWILEVRPELAQIQLDSRHTVRHGMTLLHRRAPLPTAAT
jgi:hypothetical protein